MTPTKQSYREMPLTKGQIAIVDAEDFERLSQWKWSARNCGNGSEWYALRGSTRNGKHEEFYMHRQILGLVKGDGLEIDHINRNGLDNRKENLRIVSRKDNCANRRKRNENRNTYEARRLAALFHSAAKVTWFRGCWKVRLTFRDVAEVESLAKSLP